MRVRSIRRRWLRLVRVWRGTFGLLRGFSRALSAGAKTVRAEARMPTLARCGCAKMCTQILDLGHPSCEGAFLFEVQFQRGLVENLTGVSASRSEGDDA